MNKHTNGVFESTRLAQKGRILFLHHDCWGRWAARSRAEVSRARHIPSASCSAAGPRKEILFQSWAINLFLQQSLINSVLLNEKEEKSKHAIFIKLS